jgi:hypothetical protein
MDDRTDGDSRGAVSRRVVLRRIAAGAAVAWSAPTLVSIPAAAAQGSPQPTPPTTTAPPPPPLFPPFVSAIVCPILLQARAQVVATINALIAQFPQLAAQLAAVRDAALATIDALLTQFGCPRSP